MSALELTQDQRRASGDVPPASVGSTISVVGTKLYLFAGRQVLTRRMTIDVYCLDLQTYTWIKLDVPDAVRPRPRYFHSANAHGSTIVIFGGMSATAENEDLCVLNDVAIFDTVAQKWHICDTPEDVILAPRYAHLSSISAGKLVIIGGQNKENEYLLDVGIFDLTKQVWDKIHPIKGQYGAYRSLSVTSTRMDENYPVDLAAEMSSVETPFLVTNSSPVSSRGSWHGSIKGSTTTSDLSAARRPSASSGPSIPASPARPRPNLRKKSEAGAVVDKTEERPISTSAHPIYLYSNFNFVNVERHLHMIDPPKEDFNMVDKSNLIKGATLPPGLRFPSGAVIGNHLLVSGTYLTNSSQLFAIWAMNLDSSEWIRIEVCDRLASGSWNKGIHCAARDEFILLGHRDRSLVEDYNHRQVNFDHVTIVNLEAFGLLESSQQSMSPLAQHFGKMTMADKAFCDVEIVTKDYTMIPVSSSILSQKWPGYDKYMREKQEPANQPIIGSRLSMESRHSSQYHSRADTRLKALYMPHPHAVTKLLVVFFYTDTLTSEPEPETSVLCSMLLLLSAIDRTGSNIHLLRLSRLCREKLHSRLSPKNAKSIAEVATLTGHHALQARASRYMLLASEHEELVDALMQPPVIVDGQKP